MVLGKKWLFSIGNGAIIRPRKKGIKSPDQPAHLCSLICTFVVYHLERIVVNFIVAKFNFLASLCS